MNAGYVELAVWILDGVHTHTNLFVPQSVQLKYFFFCVDLGVRACKKKKLNNQNAFKFN